MGEHHRKVVVEKGKFPRWVCSCGEEHIVLSEADVAHYDLLHSIREEKRR